MDSVYIRWDMDADSSNARRSLLSIHKTLEGALAAVPQDIKKYEAAGKGSYVVDFRYEAIEKRTLSD